LSNLATSIPIGRDWIGGQETFVRRPSMLIAAILPATLIAAPGAGAAEHAGTVTPGTSYTWTAATETNANPYYFRVTGNLQTVQGQEIPPKTLGPFEEGRCSSAAYEQCDEVLVELVNPLTQAEIDRGRTTKRRSATITLAESPERVADFDFQVFRSDAQGTQGPYWTGAQTTSQGGNFNAVTPGETLTVDVETTIAQPSKWMLIRVIRFASPNASYTGTVRF
jgi:hypothetical protein